MNEERNMGEILAAKLNQVDNWREEDAARARATQDHLCEDNCKRYHMTKHAIAEEFRKLRKEFPNHCDLCGRAMDNEVCGIFNGRLMGWHCYLLAVRGKAVNVGEQCSKNQIK